MHIFFPRTSAVEGIKSVLSVCVSVPVGIFSRLTDLKFGGENISDKVRGQGGHDTEGMSTLRHFHDSCSHGLRITPDE